MNSYTEVIGKPQARIAKGCNPVAGKGEREKWMQ
jgi:hypothetical protein